MVYPITIILIRAQLAAIIKLLTRGIFPDMKKIISTTKSTISMIPARVSNFV